MALSKIDFLKTICVAALGQLAACGLFIVLMKLYSQMHGGQEAWPMLLTAVCASFGVEIFVVFMCVQFFESAISLFKLAVSIFLSWIAGCIFFLVLDRSLRSAAPLVACAVSVVLLSLFVKLFARSSG